MNKYFGGFDDREDVAESFEVDTDFPTDEQILFASYGGGAYEGDAYVLFQRDGKLYSVTGGHCSCYGLEGQWDPEVTSLAFETERNQVDQGPYSYHFLSEHDASAEQFQAVLDAYTAQLTQRQDDER